MPPGMGRQEQHVPEKVLQVCQFRKEELGFPHVNESGMAGAPGRVQSKLRQRCGGARSAWGALSSEGDQKRI